MSEIKRYINNETGDKFLLDSSLFYETRDCDSYNCVCEGVEYERDDDGKYIKDEYGNRIKTDDSEHNTFYSYSYMDEGYHIEKILGLDFFEVDDEVDWDKEWAGKTLEKETDKAKIYVSASGKFTFTQPKISGFGALTNVKNRRQNKSTASEKKRN